MEYVEKTVKEVFEALKKNGFEHGRGTWFTDLENEKPTACILGQGAINLGVWGFTPSTHGIYYQSSIDEYNERPSSLNTIIGALDQFEVDEDNPWFMGRHAGAGTTIIAWNDKCDEIWDPAKQDHVLVYVLTTYKAVVKMAEDILKPHFDKTVELAVYDYKSPAFVEA